MKKTLSIEVKRAQLEKDLLKLSVYESLRNSLVSSMEWDAMEWHDKDEEHEETWFTAPAPDSYKYSKYMAYQDVLTEMDDFFIGK